MRNHPFKVVRDFLTHHWVEGKPLLVACSGGPDSKALLYLLIECQNFFDLQIEVAHVDHGWRKESALQAVELQEEIEGLGLSFHFKKLTDLPMKEEEAREARYEFLFQVAKEVGAQAILLGHQMEDQAETVLKRLLEGASLPMCGGMKPISMREDQTLWRPLLPVAKTELIEWLEKKNISYLHDETNLSPAYLRGRLRTDLFPFLEEALGKSVVKNLYRIGERAQKLETYLKKQIAPLLEKVEGDEIALDLLQGVDEMVLEYFLKQWTYSKGISLSLDQLSILVRMTQDSSLQLQTSSTKFEVLKGRLAIKRVNDYLHV